MIKILQIYKITVIIIIILYKNESTIYFKLQSVIKVTKYE